MSARPTVVVRGDWGGALTDNVAAVAVSVIGAFPGCDQTASPRIVIEPTADESEPPIALTRPDPSGASVVRLNVRGNLWARLTYQFAHEYCHVLADPTTWRPGPCAWLEEVLCETASLYALRALAGEWAVAPPYPNWQEYSAELARYVGAHLSQPERTLPAGVGFEQWFRASLPLLEQTSSRRNDNTIVAKELLPVFEHAAPGWCAMRHLHDPAGWPPATLADALQGWGARCDGGERPVVDAIAGRLGVALELSR